jgi:tetratricopeptide (TPR) repeat protein
MKWNVIELLLAAWLLCAGVATAQGLYQVGFVDAGAVPADTNRQLYEEIEIMRRILDRDLHTTALAGTGNLGYSPAGKELANQYLAGATLRGISPADPHHGLKGAPYGGPEWRGPHGVYLKGCGVVYSGVLPVHSQGPVRESGAAKPAQPLSQWERTRRELHGEKVDAEKERERQVPSLSEVVLKALAENGKNFTQLPDNEQVTVALTLIQGQACSNCHQGQDVRGAAANVLRATHLSPPDGNAVQQYGAAGGSTPSGGDVPPGKAGTSPERMEARRQLYLGDLHVKQNQIPQAIEVLEKAWGTYRNLLEDPKLAGAPADQRLQLEAVEVLSKLGQCFALQGDNERARKVAEELTQRSRKIGQAEGKTSPGASALPSKLIVTASKKLLDQVGAGKMTFDEFKKASTVQYLDFSAKTEKEPAKP